MTYLYDISSCLKLYRACSQTILDGMNKVLLITKFLNAMERSLNKNTYPRNASLYKSEKCVPMSRIYNNITICIGDLHTFFVSVRVLISLIFIKD